MQYQVTIQEGKEVTQVMVEADAPRLAWEKGIAAMGYAPYKFNTTMDQKASNTRRVVYTSIGSGGTLLHGLVKHPFCFQCSALHDPVECLKYAKGVQS